MKNQKTSKWLDYVAWAIVIFLLLFLTTKIVSGETTITYERGPDPVVPAVAQSQTPLEKWVDELETYECDGCEEGYKRIDSNNKYSYGCLQFQHDTFVGFSEGYNMDLNIHDCEDQKKLAIAMIEQSHDNWRHWYTSVAVRGLGEPPR